MGTWLPVVALKWRDSGVLQCDGWNTNWQIREEMCHFTSLGAISTIKRFIDSAERQFEITGSLARVSCNWQNTFVKHGRSLENVLSKPRNSLHFMENRMFSTEFTKAPHWTLYRATWTTHYLQFYFFNIHCDIFHLLLGLPKNLFPWMRLSFFLKRVIQKCVCVCVCVCTYYGLVMGVLVMGTSTLRLPWLRFFRAFSSVVRQMPGLNSQRRGTVRTLPN